PKRPALNRFPPPPIWTQCSLPGKLPPSKGYGRERHPHHGAFGMKLYYMPGACSLAPHIVANEAGIALDLVRVDGKTKKTEHDQDFLATNPNGYVPTLAFDDGRTLTEAQLVVQYLADLTPQTGLMPPPGDIARYRVQQWLVFIAS